MRIRLRFLRAWLTCRRRGHTRVAIADINHDGQTIRRRWQCARCHTTLGSIETAAQGPRPRPYSRRTLVAPQARKGR